MLCACCNTSAKKRCTECKTPYCSQECQRKDWNKHKNVCVTLPLIYVDQFDKNVFWLCDRDEEGRITSVFCGYGEKECFYIDSLEGVKEQRDKLIENGWVKGKKPTITFNFDK